MQKIAANYILSDSGSVFKNSILIADDAGNAVEIIDTKGHLDEIAQLVFHNGILVVNNFYFRRKPECRQDFTGGELRQFICLKLSDIRQISTQELVELAKQIQEEFTQSKIPEIWAAICLFLADYYRQEKQQGVLLLVGSDLIGLHFRPQSKLKRIV